MNRAVREHLRRITDTERSKTIRFLVRVRAVVAALYTAWVAWLAVVDHLPESMATLPLFATYSVVSVVLALAVTFSDTASRYAGFSIALLDMPIIVAAAALAVPAMPKPEYLLGGVLPFLGATLVLSCLSLDYGVIALSTVVAAGGAGFVMNAIGAPPLELIDPMFGMACVGVVAAFVVSRLRALVEESRRKDFAGKYVLGERIGSGGMAEVFAATYSPEGSFERRVAVKRVLPAYADNQEFVALFRREAELGAQLAHPNLVQILDFGRHLDSWFIAMEYVDGVTLADVMRDPRRETEPLPLSVSLYLVAEVAEALTYLHEKPSSDGTAVGLVHRDLNPPNVLVATSGDVKVSDFGVARWSNVEGLTRTGTVRGKIAYMAPEHLGGAAPSTGGDLYALGVMAHELITGRRMFPGKSDAEIARELTLGAVQPPSALKSDVPPSVDALVMALLAREPDQRLRSAREVIRVLRAIEGPDAPYPGGRERLAGLVTGTKSQKATATDGATGVLAATPHSRTVTINRPPA